MLIIIVFSDHSIENFEYKSTHYLVHQYYTSLHFHPSYDGNQSRLTVHLIHRSLNNDENKQLENTFNIKPVAVRTRFAFVYSLLTVNCVLNINFYITFKSINSIFLCLIALMRVLAANE